MKRMCKRAARPDDGVAILTSAVAAYAVTVSNTSLHNTQISMFTSLQTTITCGDGGTAEADAFVFISGGDS